MKKICLFFLSAVLLFAACHSKKNEIKNNDAMKFISENTIKKTIDSLVAKKGSESKIRIEKGVKQVAAFWKSEDGTEGDFKSFCVENFIPEKDKLNEFFEKTSGYFEIIYGNYNKMNLDLKRTLDLDKGEITPIDMSFGSYNPSSHLTDDLFSNKIAHTVLLNFPHYTLEEKETLGKDWTRLEWAYCRMGDAFTSRIPAELQLKEAEVSAQTDSYIAQYNIVMNNLRDNENNQLFTKNFKLITHWGLRDELKSNYSDAVVGLKKQKLIYEVMKRIISQEIPKDVINNEELIWNPYKNEVYKKNNEKIKFEREPDTRYEHLLSHFKVLKEEDQYAPYYNTYIKRAFEQSMELRQEFVEKLFKELVSSEQVKKVGQLISKRLGRDLEPFDIWYDGFKSRSSLNEDELTKTLMKKYPNVDAFHSDISNFLVKLGYKPEKAKFIASKIEVDGARGAGHAWGTQMKGDNSHLRTRIPKEGMDYKGYNIAMHELGHNVEQTITMQDIDYYMLRGVPNTAFTEAMAFMFQKKDLQMMDIKSKDANEKYNQTIDVFWSLYEIMGVSLVDMSVWKWLYENPNATPEQLKTQVIAISKDIWNKYYTPVFKKKDEPILGIYSHMISYPLYLSAYPIGYLIEFQVEDYIQTNKANFADETHRMLINGSIVPQLWMLKAVNQEISNKPMFKAVDEALLNVK